MSDLKALVEAVTKGDAKTAVEETQKALDAGSSVGDILDNGLIAAMDEVGEDTPHNPAPRRGAMQIAPRRSRAPVRQAKRSPGLRTER